MKPTPMRLIALTLLLCTSMAGCGNRSTPPGPNSVFGIVESDTHFEFLIWEEGLAIMFVDGIADEHSSSGHSSTGDPTHRQTGWAKSKEGHGYDWKIETTDGRNAKITINSIEYDIANGAVFVVHMNGKQPSVDQLDLDLSKLSDVADCQSFLKANRDAVKLDDATSEKK